MKLKLLAPILALALSMAACQDKHAGHDHAKSGDGKKASAHQHEHTPPHGGTPVVLGEEEFHLEFVRDAAARLGIIQTQSGLESFSVVMDETNNTDRDREENRLNGRIVIVPTRTIEFIKVDFVITNSGVEFV